MSKRSKSSAGRVDISLYYGPMKSGKSKALCEIVQNCMADGLKYLIFKPYTDTRDGAYLKSRHYNVSYPAYTAYSAGEIIAEWKKNPGTHVVIIDEIMFFSSDIIGVIDFFRLENSTHVYAGGLHKDFADRWFPLADFTPRGGLTMAHIIDEFDQTYLLKAKCDCCGKEATHTQRLVDGVIAPPDSPLVVVGDAMYESRCGSCYNKESNVLPKAS